MTDTTIVLITQTGAKDQKGVWRETGEIQREVFASVQSVTRAEFFAGGQSGFRPEYRFDVFHAEYQGESECEYAGVRYAIYRTYRNPHTDYMELYAERKVGVHNGQSNGA